MDRTQIQQACETVTVDSAPEDRDNLDSQVELQQETEAEKEQTISEVEKRLVREAVNAITETKNAIAAIKKNDDEAAIKAIEKAIGELEVILARDPDLAIVPTDFAISIVNPASNDREVIKDTRKEIKAAINSGNFPLARQLLASLKSEIQVIVSNIPLATYPNALKQAVRLMDEGKTEEAEEALQLALSTLVLGEDYLPIPILKARNLIERASTESDKDKAMQLLADARTQLKLSQDLGYAEGDAEYKELKTELKNLDKQLKANENTQNAFTSLKTKVAGFLERISQGKK